MQKIQEPDLLEVLGVYSMEILLREIWGESAIYPGRELIALRDEKSGDEVWLTLEREDRSTQTSLLKEYIEHPNVSASPQERFNKGDLQRLLIASFLMNPQDAHSQSFLVSQEKRLWPWNAFKSVGIPFIQTRANLGNGAVPRYQLAVLNCLYIHEFERSNGIDNNGKAYISNEPLEEDVKRPLLTKSPEEILLNWLSWPFVRQLCVRGEWIRKYDLSIEIPRRELRVNQIYMERTEQGALRYTVLDPNGRRQQGLIEIQSLNGYTLTDPLSREALIPFLPKILEQTTRNGHTSLGQKFVTDYFLTLFRNFQEKLRRDPQSSVRDLMTEYQKQVLIEYRKSGEVFRGSDTQRTMAELYEQKMEEPLFIVPKGEEDLLKEYQAFSFWTLVSGQQLYEVLLYRLLNDDAEAVVRLFNQIARNYFCRFPFLKTSIKIEQLSKEQGLHFNHCLYQFLKKGGVCEEAYKFSVLLGFDINQKENGLSLLHHAVLEGRLEKLDALFGVQELQKEFLGQDAGPQAPLETSLDMAIRLENKDMFCKLVEYGAGTKLQAPEKAHGWYMNLSQGQPSRLAGSLRKGFTTLARRHQRFGWLVVLEEVFPKSTEEAVSEEDPFPNDPELQLTYLVEKLDPHFTDRERRVFNRDLEDYNKSTNDAERSEIRKDLIGRIKRVIDRLEIGFPVAMPDPFESTVRAAISLDLESPENQGVLAQFYERIHNRIHRLLGTNLPLYKEYKGSLETAHLAYQMALSCVLQHHRSIYPNREVPEPASLSEFFAPPLLAGYLQTQNRFTGEEVQTFWSAFSEGNISIVNGFIRSFLDILRQTTDRGSDVRLVYEAYERIIKPTSLIEGAESGRRILSLAVKSKLWQGGRFYRLNQHGLCSVQSIGRFMLGEESLLEENGVLFIKQYPQVPGYEAAAGKLLLRLFDGGVPCSDLFKINQTPYLVSQGFIQGGGDLLKRKKENRVHLEEDLGRLNVTKASEFLLGTLILGSEDGKLDNLVVVPLPDLPNETQLISVDNDHAFQAMIGSQRLRLAAGLERCVEINSCVFGMTSLLRAPIPDEMRSFFLKLNVTTMCEAWVNELIVLDRRYNELFPTEHERETFLQGHGSCVTIPFTEEILMAVYDRLTGLKEILTEPLTSVRTHKDLLSLLAPTLKGRYGKLWRKDYGQYVLCADSPGGALEKNKLYVTKGETGDLAYRVLDPLIQEQHGTISPQTLDGYQPTEVFELSSLQPFLPKILEETSKKGHTTLFSFLDDEMIGGIRTSHSTTHLTSMGIGVTNYVGTPFEDRPHRAEETLEAFRRRIEGIERTLRQ